MKNERRAGSPIEVRAGEDGITVEGHAATFNEWTDIGGMFRERISPGAFADSIKRGDDVVLLIEHDGLPLARTRSGTLTLAEDDTGLLIRSSLSTEDPDVARVAPKMQRGDLDKMSFAFMVRDEKWVEPDEGLPERTIERVDLVDVSIVTWPAYEGTDIALRSMREAIGGSHQAIKARNAARIKLLSFTNSG